MEAEDLTKWLGHIFHAWVRTILHLWPCPNPEDPPANIIVCLSKQKILAPGQSNLFELLEYNEITQDWNITSGHTHCSYM